MDLNFLSLSEAQEGLEKKQFSSKELVQDCLSRIKKIDSKISAFLKVDVALSLKEATNKDELIKSDTKVFLNRPLLGIPISIKDNYCTKDLETTAASKLLDHYIPPYDATVVKKLKDAGAIILGKTNMDAWAHGSSTEASDFFTTKNPWDIKKLPGGSSGGSAASVSAHEVIASIGSETAGSIRQPASWCGVVGLKPTYGRVSRYGVIAMASSTDSPGPITKTVEDAAIILSVIAGEDGYDATASPIKVENYNDTLKEDNCNLKIGISDDYLKIADDETAKNVLEALKVLEKMGAKIIKIKLFDPKYAISVYTILQRSEVSSNLARYDGIRYGKVRSNFGDEAKRRIILGTYCLSSGYYDKYYLKAQKIRTLICKDFEKAFNEVDVIIGPTTPTPALPVGITKDQFMFGEKADVLVEPSTIAGLPGISLNCGFSLENLPIGLQIIGPVFSEGLILNIAYKYEQSQKLFLKKPKL